MSKKRAIVTYDKLSEEMKDRLEEAFPDGFGGSMTQIKTPTGETLDALLWETEEIIYLVKLNKITKKPVVIPEEEEFDDIPEEDVKSDEIDDLEEDDEEEEEDDAADEDDDDESED
jgi:hypothetical protein